MVEKHRMTPKGEGKVIVGWTEYVDLLDWGIEGVRAKVDTGARSSALHVENLRELPNHRLRFEVILSRRGRTRYQEVVARYTKRGKVRSSNGHYTERFFVQSRVRIGPVVKTIELSLVSRESMLFRMLLGRKALEHDFLVDVSHRAAMSGLVRGKRKIK